MFVMTINSFNWHLCLKRQGAAIKPLVLGEASYFAQDANVDYSVSEAESWDLQRAILPWHTLCLLIGCLLFTCSAYADTGTKIAARYMSQPEVVGHTTLRVLFWDIYDATLYAPKGHWLATQPHALKLSYRRAFSRHDIAERSAEEIRHLGFSDTKQLQRWQHQMQALFPNVDAQTDLIGVRDAAGHAHFYHNKAYLGQIADPNFSHWFFGIWLSPNTSEPELRQELLGLSPP